MFSFIVCTFN